MRVAWLADCLRAAGLTVVEEPGWKGRGAEMTGVDGIVGHHTACGPTGDCPSTSVLIHGRGAPNPLPGPLAQLQLCRSGTWHTIADGKANHAGAGSWPGIRGNTDALGIEAENQGNGSDRWPAAQIDAYARGVAAIFARLGLPASRFCAHYEWATPRGRKVDPRGPWEGGGDWWGGALSVPTANAGLFRQRVQAIIDEGDDMAGFTDEEKARLLAGADAAVAMNNRWDANARTKVEEVWTNVMDRDDPDPGFRNGTVGAMVQRLLYPPFADVPPDVPPGS